MKAVIEITGIKTPSFFISLIAKCFSMVIWCYIGINHMFKWHYHVAITTELLFQLALSTSNVILKGHLLLRSNPFGKRQQCWH